VWSAVDVDSKELLALEASYGRSSLNALAFLKKALRMCTNKPLVIVDRGPWYRWAFERLGLEYRHERFGMRNRVERFFRYLKERTVVFHHKMSARNHVQGITNLKLFLSLFTLYYQAGGQGGEQKCLFGHYQAYQPYQNSKHLTQDHNSRGSQGLGEAHHA
jgi:transposase-like protein